jgi:hypothetical protein
VLKPVTRMYANFLKDSNWGLVATAQRLLGAPGDFELALYNSADDKCAMSEDVAPDSVPAYVTWVDSSTKGTSQGHRNILLAGGLYTAADADEVEASELAELCMRAALLCSYIFNTSRAEPYRELDGVRILKVVEATEDAILSAKGRFRLWGLSAIHLLATDTKAAAA